MPMVCVFTTVAKSLVTETFAAALGQSVAKHLEIGEEYVTVRVVPDQLMFTGGKTTPFVHVTVTSISDLNATKNSEMTPDLTKIVEEHLKVPAGQILLMFNRIDPTCVAIDGHTFPADFGQ